MGEWWIVDSKLILIDGIPGSGKSTTGEWLCNYLVTNATRARFYDEMAEHHPLRIYDWTIESLEPEDEAGRFQGIVIEKFREFAVNCLAGTTVHIMEAYLFQDTLCFAYMMGMDGARIRRLFHEIANILKPTNPTLIFYQQMDVERNWRWICELRGPEFTQKRCGLYTDDDFARAGREWAAIQEFALSLVDEWTCPKIVIQNTDYRWGDYRRRILGELGLERWTDSV